jgi:methionine-S-sulfoxide reductase
MKRLGLLIGLLSFGASMSGVAQSAQAAQSATELATFAGGCFWCMEPAFEKVKGVSEVLSGYTGGQKQNPTYEEVSSGTTGHAESVQVKYDPAVVTYAKLLDVYWMNVDPLDADGQFCDKGNQYRTAIFTHSAEQKKLAEASRDALAKSDRFKGKKIVTEITPATTFTPAEDYHQGYYKKNPIRYKFYRSRCGRDARLDEVWGKDRKSAH